jgi:predicted nucleic acid-binding protein
MEAEVRAILEERLSAPEPAAGLGSRMHARFAALGGMELAPPDREESPRATDAATCLSRRCRLGTRNVKDFADTG